MTTQGISKIVFDVTPARRGAATGIGRVTESLVQAIEAALARDPSTKKIATEHFARGGAGVLLTRWLGERGALFHAFEHRLDPLLRSPKILSIHDCWTLWPNEWQSPAFQQKQSVLQATALRRADWIVAPTEHVRREALRFDARLEKKMSVIPWAVPTDSFQPRNLREAAGLEKLWQSGRPFVLHVSTVEARKNQLELFRAMKRLLPEVQFVFVGQAQGYGAADAAAALAELKTCEGFYFFESLDRHSLRRCYERTSLFVHPSRDEGFGLPLLEAMESGAPLLLSSIPTFREIAGETASYFDPSLKAKDLAEGIGSWLKLSRGPGSNEAARALAEKYSWQRSAAAYLELYARFF